MKSKLQQILLNHLPKERVHLIHSEHAVNGKPHETDEDRGHNACLQEIIKALPEIEEEILAELNSKVVVYVSPTTTHYDLSHEDRLKVNAEECTIYLADSAGGVWGDDWNDAPDEHNSGEPYTETMQNPIVITAKLGKPLDLLTSLTKDNG